MKPRIFDPAIAQWALRDQAVTALIALIIGAVSLAVFAALCAIVESEAFLHFLQATLGLLALIEITLAFRLVRLHRRIEQLDKLVP